MSHRTKTGVCNMVHQQKSGMRGEHFKQHCNERQEGLGEGASVAGQRGPGRPCDGSGAVKGVVLQKDDRAEGADPWGIAGARRSKACKSLVQPVKCAA